VTGRCGLESGTAVERYSDYELVRLVEDGADWAARELFERHLMPGLRFARSRGIPAATAERLVADTFAELLALARGGRRPMSPGSFVTAGIIRRHRSAAGSW
jgi:DNA-directed RNA polymerase specialized sigma24 family protein